MATVHFYYLGQSVINNQPQKVGESGSTDNSTGQTSQQKTEFAVGDIIAVDGKEITVESVDRNWNSGNTFITPAEGKEYVKVNVKIENKSSSEIDYNSFDWKMQDSSGVIVDVDMNSFGDGMMKSGSLAEGGKVVGSMIFEVPKDDTGLKLQYKPVWSTTTFKVNL